MSLSIKCEQNFNLVVVVICYHLRDIGVVLVSLIWIIVMGETVGCFMKSAQR